jgi:hypothetical protein
MIGEESVTGDASYDSDSAHAIVDGRGVFSAQLLKIVEKLLGARLSTGMASLGRYRHFLFPFGSRNHFW